MIEFILNGKPVSTDDDPTTPLLWVVRDTFKLKGSKFGCGAGLCGACTMHIDDEAMRTCMLPISTVAGRRPPIARAAATSQGGTLARHAANMARLGCPGGAFIAHLSRPAPLPTFVAPCSLQGAQRDVH